MRFCIYSCILLAMAVVVTLCDADSATHIEKRPSARSEIPGIISERKKRSPILGISLGIGGAPVSTPNTQGAPLNGFGSSRYNRGYNAGTNNQNGGINLGLGLLNGLGVTNIIEPSPIGVYATEGIQGGSTNTGDRLPSYIDQTGNGYHSGTSGQTYPSDGNRGETSGTSLRTDVPRRVVPAESTAVQPSRVTTNAPTGGCILPAQPTGGRYQLGSCTSPCQFRPGSRVPVGSFLTYTCDEDYILRGNNVTFCHNDKWYMSPTCAKSCRALKSNSVDLVCKHQGNTVSCKSNIKPGTIATMACKNSYKIPLANDPVYRELTCQDDGFWDRTLIRCIPECGTSVAQGNTLIVSGFTAQFGAFPWHVGIYEKNSSDFYAQICAGSLISPMLVISAAHCFYDDAIQGLKDPRRYAVAAGKYFRSYNWPEKYVQKSMIHMIEIANRYYGASGNFAEDIAIIRLKSPFTLSTLVRPICMDWDNVHERDHLQYGKVGKVVGWGKTAEGVPSTQLQEINLPYIPFEQCISSVPEDFRGYVTSDKFCAGYLNGSSLCEGDSGGGLGFQIGGLWYLRGIVSVSPVAENTCDNNYYTAFTNVGYFREWIRAMFIEDQ